MNTTDAAGGKDVDPGHMGDNHGGGHGGCAIGSSRHQSGKVPAAGFSHVPAGFAQVFDLLMAEARFQSAADYGNGGGNGAVFADGLLHKQRGLHVFGIRHAVGDDGALQRDDGLTLFQGGLYFRCNVKIFVHWFSPFIFHRTGPGSVFRP